MTMTTKSIVFMLANGLLTIILWLIGGVDLPLKIFIVFSILDLITGIMKSLKGKSEKTIDGKLNSKIMLMGWLKFGSMLAIIIMGNMFDMLIMANSPFIRNYLICGFICNQGISILENVSAYTKVPSFFYKFISDQGRKFDEGKEQ